MCFYTLTEHFAAGHIPLLLLFFSLKFLFTVGVTAAATAAVAVTTTVAAFNVLYFNRKHSQISVDPLTML